MSSVRPFRPQLALDTLESRLVPSTTVLDLTQFGAEATTPSGAVVRQTGTPGSPSEFGELRTFLRVNGFGVEQGVNSGSRCYPHGQQWGTAPLRLGQVSVVNVGGVAYREFLLNANEPWWAPTVSLNEVQVFLADSGNLRGYNPRTNQLAGRNAVFDLDAGGDVSIKIDARLNGGGSVDMVLLVPDAAFAGGNPDTFVYLYSQFGGWRGSWASGGSEEWSVRRDPVALPPTGASISGAVRLDDGTPLSGVTIQLYGISNGVEVQLETVTDANGVFTFGGLEAGEYMLTEIEPVSADPAMRYADGDDLLGFIEGTTDQGLWGFQELDNEFDVFVQIQLGTDQRAVNYTFTESLVHNA